MIFSIVKFDKRFCNFFIGVVFQIKYPLATQLKKTKLLFRPRFSSIEYSENINLLSMQTMFPNHSSGETLGSFKYLWSSVSQRFRAPDCNIEVNLSSFRVW